MQDSPQGILSFAIQFLLKQFDGTSYEKKRSCPKCGTEDPYSVGYNTRILAILIENHDTQKIKVKVRRFRCRNCGNHYYAANAPFYPNCDYGKMIVDLCLYLLERMEAPSVENTLKNLGIQVDRSTITRYRELFPEKAVKTPIPNSQLRADIIEILIKQQVEAPSDKDVSEEEKEWKNETK